MSISTCHVVHQPSRWRKETVITGVMGISRMLSVDKCLRSNPLGYSVSSCWRHRSMSCSRSCWSRGSWNWVTGWRATGRNIFVTPSSDARSSESDSSRTVSVFNLRPMFCWTRRNIVSDVDDFTAVISLHHYHHHYQTTRLAWFNRTSLQEHVKVWHVLSESKNPRKQVSCLQRRTERCDSRQALPWRRLVEHSQCRLYESTKKIRKLNPIHTHSPHNALCTTAHTCN